MSQSKPVIVVQGGQWGSEAKGNIAAKLCVDRKVEFAVRTGAINAGHTVVYGGKPYAMQQIPTGWVNPDTKLVIGAGAYIHPPTLAREVGWINEAMPEANVLDRLIIDFRCGVHDESAEEASKKANRHHLIGATGKGCSEAIVNKIRNRNAGYKLFKQTFDATDDYNFTDTVRLLNNAIDADAQVLLEGTQGTLLDLHLGPYPFTTSRMTSAANWIAEAGLSPSLDYEVVLVVRTYPIRVAGNSGPMPREIEWTDLARTINGKLQASGMLPKVSYAALAEFEEQLHWAARAGGYPANIRLSTWTPEEREQYRVAASELHRDALNRCSPQVVAELRKLFEMTTVTKKLRRIAELDIHSLKYAVAINRPTSIALTFADYIEPELAGNTVETLKNYPAHAYERLFEYMHRLEEKLEVDISMYSTGPGLENVIPVE